MFISVAEELEREAPRRVLQVGEDQGFIRRTLLARSRLEEARWRARFARQRRLGSRADIPLGIRQPPRLSSPQPRPGLSSVAQPAISPQATYVPTAPVGPAGPPQPGVLSTIKPRQPMNLSNILGQVTDIARTYYDIRGMRSGGYQPGARPIMATPVSSQFPVPSGGQMSRGLRISPGGIVGGAIGGELLERGYDFFFGDDEMQLPAGVCKPSDIVYSWDEKTMSYVPKKKRKARRRQLVTKGDIKGLAALKGVVGTGKIMETWIATHC